jgi:TetR/AcrR family transcriptional regulator, copper-responsive repressor
MFDAKRSRGRPATFDRDAALNAAVSLFWRHGYDGTSISMLTEVMGVTPPTLYSAFGSKEALYREALTRYRQQETEANAEVLDGSPTVYRMLEGFLRTSASRFTAPEGGRGCMVSVGCVQSGPDGQAAVAATAAARGEALQRFIALLDAAKRKGEIPAETDSVVVARFYTAIVQGMAVQATDGADTGQLNALADFALAAWPGSSR